MIDINIYIDIDLIGNNVIFGIRVFYLFMQLARLLDSLYVHICLATVDRSEFAHTYRRVFIVVG